MTLDPDDIAALSLNVDQIDCAVAVMLKILDGKCKMPALEKVIMEELYDVLKDRKGRHLTEVHHHLIVNARAKRDQGTLDDQMIEEIYENRLYAETMISRPVMKHFKASLRENGILPSKMKESVHV